MLPRLFATLRAPVVADTILSARPLLPPTLGRLLTGFTAIACLRTRRPERLFAALQETKPLPTPFPPLFRLRWAPASLWTFTARYPKMTWVHGSRLVPAIKSRSEALTSLRGALFNRSSPPFLCRYYTQSRDPARAHWPCQWRAFGP